MRGKRDDGRMQGLNCSNTGMAELELTKQLEALGIINVAFAHGTVIALYGCVFQYST